MLTEEVVGLGSYGTTLTVFFADTASRGIDSEAREFDEEHNLIESWTPRFRR